jgi:hypothetical protein
MGRKHEEQLTVPFPPEQVAQRAQQVLASMPKVSGVWHTPPVVGASTGVGMMSWGEKITVQITEAAGGSGVRIHSECSFPLQLIDYGKNKKNVQYVVDGLAAPPQAPA